MAYGFSGLNGSWGSVAMPEPAQVADDYAMVVSKDRISVFSAHTGSWAESPLLNGAK
jgi:hypothetical protein